MANHKRHRPKHQRAGCLWCKPHKDERVAWKPRCGGNSMKRPNELRAAAIREGLNQ